MEAASLKQNEISLRPATPEDDAFLFEVYASTRIDELSVTGWDDTQKEAFTRMQFTAQTRCYPAADNQIILMDQQQIGRMLVDRNDDSVLLRDIALLPPFRNRGIGTSLIQNLMTQAKATGKLVRLSVLASNPAIRLYKRLGFVISGEDSAYLKMIWNSSSPQ